MEEMDRYRYVPSDDRPIDGGTIYDRENEEAWIRSTVVVPVVGPNRPEITYDREAGAYHVEYDPDDDASLSRVIVDALVDVGVFDPDERADALARLESMAIDELAADANEHDDGKTVSLSLGSFLVRITRRGRISIYPSSRD